MASAGDAAPDVGGCGVDDSEVGDAGVDDAEVDNSRVGDAETNNAAVEATPKLIVSVNSGCNVCQG